MISDNQRDIQLLKDVLESISDEDIEKYAAASCIKDSLLTRISMLEEDGDVFSLEDVVSSLIDVLISDCEDNFTGEDKDFAENYINILASLITK